MSLIRTFFDVKSTDGQVLLPVGAQYTLEELNHIIATSRKKKAKTYALMDSGEMRKDMQHFISLRPYQVIFADNEERAAVLATMERVRLPAQLLESIEYFKENDFHTYRHMLMIFALSILMARVLVPDGPESYLEAAAGPTHDLGKILVPSAILQKREPLTKNEREILEFHAVAGYVLLGYYLDSQESVAARVARDHHERLNGSGYPLGIQQQDRLVEIVSACDVYDALISPRPYRAIAYENRVALEEVTVMAEQGEISWDVLQALIAFNRGSRLDQAGLKVSTEKRGTSPPGNSYGLIASPSINEEVIG